MSVQNNNSGAQCLNCTAELTGEYCAHCGQKHINEPLTVSFLVRTFFSTLTNTDAQFIQTLKQLIIKPGYVAKSYASGKRKQYINPMRLSFVIIGIYLAILALTGGIASFSADQQIQQALSSDNLSIAPNDFRSIWFDLYVNHRIIIYLGALPFAALMMRYAFYKSGFSYFSTLVMLLYTSALYSFYGIIMVLIYTVFDFDYFSQYRKLVEGGIGLIVFFQSAKSFYGLSWLKSILYTPLIFVSLSFSAYLVTFLMTVGITVLG